MESFSTSSCILPPDSTKANQHSEMFPGLDLVDFARPKIGSEFNGSMAFDVDGADDEFFVITTKDASLKMLQHGTL